MVEEADKEKVEEKVVEMAFAPTLLLRLHHQMMAPNLRHHQTKILMKTQVVLVGSVVMMIEMMVVMEVGMVEVMVEEDVAVVPCTRNNTCEYMDTLESNSAFCNKYHIVVEFRIG